jgi:hypothetical protein
MGNPSTENSNVYTDRNFKSAKALREAVVKYLLATAAGKSAREVTYYQPGGMSTAPRDGRFTIEGPHYPEPHKFYVRAVARDNRIMWVNGLPAALNPDNPNGNVARGIEILKEKFPTLVPE